HFGRTPPGRPRCRAHPRLDRLVFRPRPPGPPPPPSPDPAQRHGVGVHLRRVPLHVREGLLAPSGNLSGGAVGAADGRVGSLSQPHLRRRGSAPTVRGMNSKKKNIEALSHLGHKSVLSESQIADPRSILESFPNP